MMFDPSTRATTAADCAQPTTVGEYAVHIVHEVNQPLAAILINAEAALRWLTREPANVDEAKQAVELIIENSYRAADVIKSVRDLIRQFPPSAESGR